MLSLLYFCSKSHNCLYISFDIFLFRNHLVPISHIASCILLSISCKVFRSLTNGLFLNKILNQPKESLVTNSPTIDHANIADIAADLAAY